MSENEVLSPYIGDGYDLEQTIPESPGRWPAVRIRYRPLSADDEGLAYMRKAFAPDVPLLRFMAELFAGTPERKGNLIAWDLKGRDGKPVPLTAENIGKLTAAFYGELQSVIDGSKVIETKETQADADLKN